MTTSYLVERYWPGISLRDAEDVLAREAEAARELCREGRPVHVVRTTFVEEDETLLSIVEARAEADVVELGVRAGRPADRIVAAQDLTASAGKAQ